MKNINNTITIDGIDKEIIRSLMTNARTPILEIAKKIGVSVENNVIDSKWDLVTRNWK